MPGSRPRCSEHYEPFFSSTSEYEDEVQLVEWGVSPTLRYDPLGRKIRVDHPDGTYERVEFDAWTQWSYDRCDTVLDSDWYDERDPGDREVVASVEHDDTPSVAHLDPLGRTFLTAETPDDGTTTYETRLTLDVLGRTLNVNDARGNDTQTDVYDALGRSAHTTSPDAGETWVLADLAGQPSVTWKTGDLKVEQTYDALRRPRATIVTEGVAAARVHVFNVYGEFTDAPGGTANTLGRLWRQYDGAGLVETEYDFKGNVVSTERTFLDDVDTEVDWTDLLDDADVGDLDTTASGDLLGTSYATTMTYDALNRVVTSTTPDDSVTRNNWNEGGLLEKVEVQVRGDSTWTPMVRSIDYNARGQRTAIVYSENAGETDGAFTTAYDYDPETFRLTRLRTIRENDGKRLQDLKYTYDACGNIVQITDDAQQTIFFDNAWADPVMLYRYDSLYRLISAQGREHLSLVQPGTGSPDEEHFIADGTSTVTYLETYEYDEVGNILEMTHQGGTEETPGSPGWTRTYTYEATSNRLLTTTIPASPFTVSYTHNYRGAMTAMPHLTGIARQFDDQIRSVDINGSDDAVYHYDSSGNRVRKVYRHGSNTDDRLYIGAWELFRSSTGSLQEERETLHVMDDKRRIAMIETLTTTGGSEVTSPTPLFRFQLGNHLESAAIEVDESGAVISYEEYHPYGSTSWWATNSSTEVSGKRYRYTGKERDDESGLAYHGIRFLIPWLGRWDAPDPIGLAAGLNRYRYSSNDPVSRRDPSGTKDESVTEIDFEPILVTGGLSPEEFAQAEAEVLADSPVIEMAPDRWPKSSDYVVFRIVDNDETTPANWFRLYSSGAIEPTSAFDELEPSIMAMPSIGFGVAFAGEMLRGGPSVWAEEATLALAGEGIVRGALGAADDIYAALPPTRATRGAFGSRRGAVMVPGPRGTATGASTSQSADAQLSLPFVPSRPLTRGNLILSTGLQTPISSGVAGPAQTIPSGTPGFDIVTRTHVEGHAAALMRIEGASTGTLYINNPAVCVSCDRLLVRMLPEGATLTVVLPDGRAIPYLGVR